MEDVLDVYHRPRDSECPVVCLDETSKQLIAETRVPIPAKPGRPARIDYEYERNELLFGAKVADQLGYWPRSAEKLHGWTVLDLVGKQGIPVGAQRSIQVIDFPRHDGARTSRRLSPAQLRF